jgi:hypothetical protein
MKDSLVTLPLLRYKGLPVKLGIDSKWIFIANNHGSMMLIFHKMWLIGILVAQLLIFGWLVFMHFAGSSSLTPEPKSVSGEIPVVAGDEDFDLPLAFDDDFPEATILNTKGEDVRQNFIMRREKLIFYYKTLYGVGRIDQLDEKILLELHARLTAMFIREVLDRIQIEPHVYKYLTDHSDLNKLETALMEQVKFHVPASIKLAQSAVETGYGKRVIRNNYFGIKDKSRETKPEITTEYYTEAEKQANQHIIISCKKVNRNGKEFYKCLVRDHFKNYESPWASFRAHSIFLASNDRYAPLFTGGKKYQAWADRIGSSKYGGVGYATSPIYGSILKGVIQKYHLDLLDF